VSLVDEPDGVCFPGLLLALAALRRVRAAFSLGVSVVTKLAQTLDENVLICWPRDDVALSNWSRVESVCCLSLAKDNHTARSKRRS
jgi:hypothetical protein